AIVPPVKPSPTVPPVQVTCDVPFDTGQACTGGGPRISPERLTVVWIRTVATVPAGIRPPGTMIVQFMLPTFVPTLPASVPVTVHCWVTCVAHGVFPVGVSVATTVAMVWVLGAVGVAVRVGVGVLVRVGVFVMGGVGVSVPETIPTCTGSEH